MSATRSPVQNPNRTLPRWLARFFFQCVEAAQRRIARGSLVGDRPIFDNALFPWVGALEAQAPAIAKELDAVLATPGRLPAFHEISPDVATITQDHQWQTFVFLGYGMRAERNLARCPATAAALDGIPGLRTAFFSILSPGKQIPLHSGPYNGVLRLHLALKVPREREQCWIEVNGQRYVWQANRAVIFDDAYPHEVHNDTDETRVVLFVDFERPCKVPVSWLNRLLLAFAPLTPELQQAKTNHEKWERDYYADDGQAAPDTAPATAGSGATAVTAAAAAAATPSPSATSTSAAKPRVPPQEADASHVAHAEHSEHAEASSNERAHG
ncbi:aspartyl/asparaginyl beta-hydroxylase domain-containing protein [Pandoraea norimbergensis]|uniref:aspartyl/asparaginyl beta-hydroxylase domain-containing protein n=1 Tax=Pandoraea norimbergensis TaxID=93219 RepID=UPI000A5C5E4A|nr:aspartyl/asparaginyl beta-hydroxylase domain-containing protein [Pandoraea norimbergensis]